jgi:hypothetical protein
MAVPGLLAPMMTFVEMLGDFGQSAEWRESTDRLRPRFIFDNGKGRYKTVLLNSTVATVDQHHLNTDEV